MQINNHNPVFQRLDIWINTHQCYTFLKLSRWTTELTVFIQRPQKPPLIIVKNSKHKELVKSRGKQLKNTTYGMYDQFPKQTQDRRLQHQGTSPQRSPYRSEVELSITAVVNHLSYCRARTHTHTHTHTHLTFTMHL